MPKHPIDTHFLSQEAQDVIGQVHPQTAPARAVLEKEGFRYRNYIDIFDGGPTLECDIDRAPSVKVGWWKWQKGSLRKAIFRPAWSPMKIITISAWCWCVPDPATNRLILTAAQLHALKCHAGDRVRLVRLCAEEKTA